MSNDVTNVISALAANGYARHTGEVGVCLATSGPGATNLITGIADAFLDSVPLVAITGQVPTGLMGTDAFQEVDILGITLPIVKHSYVVRDANTIFDTVREAFRIAREGRPGPVLIDVPKDIANALVRRYASSADATHAKRHRRPARSSATHCSQRPGPVLYTAMGRPRNARRTAHWQKPRHHRRHTLKGLGGCTPTIHNLGMLAGTAAAATGRPGGDL